MTNQTLPAYDETDQLIANTLRMLAIDGVQQANSGHPGLPLGAADMATVIWTRFLKAILRIQSGTIAIALFSLPVTVRCCCTRLLHLLGYPMPLAELKRFRQWGSLTPGHPEYDPKMGIETTTGPLGQGFGNAVGIALAERWLAARFNKPDFPIV